LATPLGSSYKDAGEWITKLCYPFPEFRFKTLALEVKELAFIAASSVQLSGGKNC